MLNAYKADLHIHTVLSPCGDLEMSPTAIVERALSRGLDMIAIPGETPEATISAIIADEASIGVINNKTTAVRLIPVYGKGVGEYAEFGGLLGGAPIMEVSSFSSEEFIKRGGRIPAPVHSFKN